jgi:response regulator NasT
MGHQAQVSLSRTVCFLGCELVDCESIASDVVAAGFRISGTFNDAQSFETFIARSGATPVVVINVAERTENQLGQIGKICARHVFPVLALLKNCNETLAIRALEAGAQSILALPASSEAIYSAMITAILQRARQSKLEAEIDGLKNKLAERKLIERAKGILMSSMNILEVEAFRLMQKQSQEQSRPMVDIANAIVSTSELMERAGRLQKT